MGDTALRFYREGKSWYADIPLYLATGGHKADCLMVAGADKLLDEIAGKRSSVTLSILGAEVMRGNAFDSYSHVLKCQSRDVYGWAYYNMVYSPPASKVESIGLCPVSAFVFGGHPMFIGFKEVRE